MACSLDKLIPFSIDRPDILYGLHSFHGPLTIGPAHYRLPAYNSYTSNSGTPEAIFNYAGELIRAMDDCFFTTSSYLDPAHRHLTSDLSYALINNLLVISDGDEILAYDSDHTLWGFQALGNNTPGTSDTPMLSYGSGNLTSGDYYYRMVYVDEYYQRSHPSPAVGPISIASDAGTATFSAIPLDYVNKRRYTEIYRTYVDHNDSGYDSYYYLVGNTTSSGFVDTKSDADLTETLRYGLSFGSEYGNKPAGHNLLTWGQRLTWTQDNRLYISAIDDAGNPWPGVTLQSYTIGDDSDIIATALKDKSLIVFKATGIWLVENYTYNIHQISATHGIAAKSQVTPYISTVAFLSGGHIYILDGLKDISEKVAPVFNEYDAHGVERLWTDHQGHLFVTAQVIRNTNPTWDTPKYVTYIFYRGEWTRMINLDWQVSFADHANNRTLGITSLGRLEILDWSRSKEGSYTPAVISSFTCTSASSVTLSSVSAFTSGDYVWYYNSNTSLWYNTQVSTITGTTLTLADPYARLSHSGDYIGIGTQYYAASGPLYSEKAEDVDVNQYRALVEGDTTQPLISFGYDATAKPQPLSQCYNNDHLTIISAKRRGWYLRPMLSGLAHGVMQILRSTIDLMKAGRA